jgi:diamine N-acetyltransferase
MSTPNFVLRLARLDELAAIAAMAKRIWNVHYLPIIGQVQVDYMLELMYSESALQHQVREGQVFYIGSLHGRDVGYISVSLKEQSVYFLHKFYIETDVQGKGLGKLFFEELLKIYADLNTFYLTVNRKNFKSINFYFKLGFVIEEVKDFDIGSGFLMEDFVMRWSLV